MKLAALHESNLVVYGMSQQVLGAKSKELADDLFRPRDPVRWYHRGSPHTLQHLEQPETELPPSAFEPLATIAEGQGDGLVHKCIRLPVGDISGDLIVAKRLCDESVTAFWDLSEDAYRHIEYSPAEQGMLLHAAARELYAIVEWDESDQWRRADGRYVRRINVHDHTTIPTAGQVIGLRDGYTAQICDGGPECPDHAHA